MKLKTFVVVTVMAYAIWLGSLAYLVFGIVGPWLASVLRANGIKGL
jgi:hypothetical protein